MRPLEILLLLSFLPILGLPFLTRRTRGMVYVAVLPLVITAFQLIFEGYRWQLVPAYALVVVVLLVRLPQMIRADTAVHRRRLGFIGSGFALLIIGIAAALALLFPVFRYPTPTGEYAVGTTARQLYDETRDRMLMIQLWYPSTDVSNARRADYLPKKLAPALITTMGMPSFAFDHIRYVQSHSYEDAPIDGTYPVLLFSHGMQGYRHQNVAQMEELASHGYIVVSIDHTDYAAAVILLDGSVLPFTAQHELDNREQSDAAMRETWQLDQHFVFDRLDDLNQSDALLTGKLDLNRVGAFGHSFGGATLTFFCEDEPRCLASINMDGSMPTADTAWQKPFVYLMSDDQFMEQPEPTDEQLAEGGMTREQFREVQAKFVQNYQQNFALKGEQGYWLHINGMKHLNFSDVEFASPLFSLIGMTGSINPLRGNQIMNEYLLAFFNTYVKGESPSPLITGESPEYPEVQVVSAEDLPTLP